MQLGSITRWVPFATTPSWLKRSFPQHWEIEFFGDGHVEIERFFADPEGVFDDESLLDALIEENQD